MGLVESMQLQSGPPETRYFWDAAHPESFTITVSMGAKARRSVTVQRGPSAKVTLRQTTPNDGFVGALWTPTAPAGPKPAVVVIGGSEGGLGNPLISGVLASHGYPTLNVAYFGAPSLPGGLQAIPIEYFARAVGWLRRQPNVDPAKITVIGASRGSEAAMLVAEHYPDLVHGVVVLSPSNVSLCSFPGCDGPAWTFAGQAVPFTRTINQPQPADAPDAVLPVTNVDGPVLSACGGADRIWTSCPYAQALTTRLDAAHPGAGHGLLSYLGAGHGVGFVPYEPGTEAANTQGRNPQANQLADDDLWPKLLTFLATGTTR